MNSYDYSDEEDAVSRFWFLRWWGVKVIKWWFCFLFSFYFPPLLNKVSICLPNNEVIISFWLLISKFCINLPISALTSVIALALYISSAARALLPHRSLIIFAEAWVFIRASALRIYAWSISLFFFSPYFYWVICYVLHCHVPSAGFWAELWIDEMFQISW